MEEMELNSGFELGGDEALLWEHYSSLKWTYDTMSDEQKSLRKDMTEAIENNCKKRGVGIWLDPSVEFSQTITYNPRAPRQTFLWEIILLPL